jgi:hypothetical protein
MMNFPCNFALERFVVCRAKPGVKLLIGIVGAMSVQDQFGRPSAGTDKMMQVWVLEHR